MLDIIRSTRTHLTAYAFGWGQGLRDGINNMIRRGENNLSSLVAKNEEKVNKELADALATYAANANS